jgi:very-short-patch-repair endonuclease
MDALKSKSVEGCKSPSVPLFQRGKCFVVYFCNTSEKAANNQIARIAYISRSATTGRLLPFLKGGWEGFSVVHYRYDLKHLARNLRSNMTDAEQILWFHLRRKQIAGVQFFRQRPIGEYIVDFYAPMAKLIIEVDGSQHLNNLNQAEDAARTTKLEALGFQVLRFDNLQVLQETDSVLEVIHQELNSRK